MRKICFVITSHIHYARSKIILQELKDRPGIELQIVVGASAILPKYGDVLSLLEQDGFKADEKITMTLEGGNPVAMAKTAGIGIVEFTTAFDNLKPDVVMVRGDRYEVLAATVAAAYLNISVAHIEGGDLSGTIDESVRHAVTKLSHLHFATNDEAHNRIRRMGENPEYIYNFGSPDLEFVMKNDFKPDNEYINKMGVGDMVDVNKQYLMVLQHPVTSETDNLPNIKKTLEAVYESGVSTIWFWPNVDAGTDDISSGIRNFREKKNPKNIRFIKFLPPEQFVGLLSKAACLVGNSSSGIKECSFLGTPAVNIGTRQNGRMRAGNVVDVNYDKEEIKNAIKDQLANGRYESSNIYCKPNTAKNIVDVLVNSNLYTQKVFHD